VVGDGGVATAHVAQISGCSLASTCASIAEALSREERARLAAFVRAALLVPIGELSFDRVGQYLDERPLSVLFHGPAVLGEFSFRCLSAAGRSANVARHSDGDRAWQREKSLVQLTTELASGLDELFASVNQSVAKKKLVELRCSQVLARSAGSAPGPGAGQQILVKAFGDESFRLFAVEPNEQSVRVFSASRSSKEVVLVGGSLVERYRCVG